MKRFTNKLQRYAAGSLVAALVAAAAPAYADSPIKTVRVVGEAAATPGDKAKTENDAKRAARRKAVEEGAGVLVKSNTVVRNFQLVADEIVTSAKGVIVSESWGELTQADGVATISLDAKVSPDAIEDSLCTVIQANHSPKVTLVFVEKTGDETQPWSPRAAERGLIEAMFTSAFKDACFTIVESGVKVTEVSATGDIPQDTIREIIKNSDAQYIVLGQGKVVKSDKTGAILGETRMNSYSISASIKLISTTTNEIEAVASESAQVLGISPEQAMKAAEKAKGRVVVDTVMDEMFQKVAERWSSDLVNQSRVELIVRGVPDIATVKALTELMNKQLQNAKVEKRGLAEGQVRFDIDVEGGADTLAEVLDGKKVGKSTLSVTELVRGKVIVVLK